MPRDVPSSTQVSGRGWAYASSRHVRGSRRGTSRPPGRSGGNVCGHRSALCIHRSAGTRRIARSMPGSAGGVTVRGNLTHRSASATPASHRADLTGRTVLRADGSAMPAAASFLSCTNALRPNCRNGQAQTLITKMMREDISSRERDHSHLFQKIISVPSFYFPKRSRQF